MSRLFPKEFALPDYAGGSILNLMASIVRARSGRTPHAPLRGFACPSAAASPRLVLLVLDGIGENQLRGYLARRKTPSPFFGRLPHRVVTTVCPATTAAAVTTFATGGSPAEHALLGWHVHFPDLGMVATPLPFRTRTGTPLARGDFPLAEYLAFPRHLATVRGERRVLSPAPIPASETTCAQDWWTKKTASDGTLRDLEAKLLRAVRSRKAFFLYAYHPDCDTLSHRFGPSADAPRRHLARLDRMLARVAAACGKGTTLLVTADHGHEATETVLDLSAVEGFYGTLAMLPSGDARLVHCFVRPGKRAAFRKLVMSSKIAPFAACVEGRKALEAGLFGPGRPHPALEARTGDWLLAARAGVTMVSPPAMEEARFHLGSHGGLSENEIRVPLFCVRGADGRTRGTSA